MDKIGFWLMVGVVAIVSVYVFKLVSSQTNIQGLQDFAQAI